MTTLEQRRAQRRWETAKRAVERARNDLQVAEAALKAAMDDEFDAAQWCQRVFAEPHQRDQKGPK